MQNDKLTKVNNAELPAPSSAPEREKSENVLIRWIGGIDRPFLFLLIILLALGTVMVFTASYSFAQTRYGDSYYFSKKQIIWIVVGLAVMMLAIHIPDRWVKKYAWLVYLLAVALNAAVYIMGVAKHGAQRWIDIGPIRFQPSEVLKFATILVCAKVIANNTEKIKKFRFGVLPFIVFAFIGCALLVQQSHLSATIITFVIIFAMMFIGGSKLLWVGVFGGIPVAIGMYAVTNIDTIINWSLVQKFLGHTYTRLLVWTDPFKYMRDDATGWAGWQPAQSIYAISSGGVWGVGLGQSMQKHGYLPEPQNDYIFAILCEEFGFVGAVAVIGLFAALIIRGFIIARNCRDKFCQMVIYGLMIKLAMQVIFNIGVVTGTLPATGISLPFFSYGGTALIMSLVEMGIVLSFSRYSYTERGTDK
ncbi:MAG: cell division protein FtsW [Clostridia bacterium]|nr:cell division protein FtsW [Clostridia bacterium]